MNRVGFHSSTELFSRIAYNYLLPTAYVVRREGYVLTHVCPAVCPHLGRGYSGQVHMGMGGGVLQPGEAGGYPCRGVLHLGYPCQTWPGGTLPGGYPTLGTPLSDLVRGYPRWGYPAGRYPTLGTPHQTWPGGVGYSPPFQVDLAGVGYPTSGSTWSTRYAAVGMPLAFKQEDFLVLFNPSLIPVQLMSP